MQARGAQLLRGHDGGTPRGDHILDHDDRLPGLGTTLHGLVGAVALLTLAHDGERLAAGQRDGRDDGHGAQLGGYQFTGSEILNLTFPAQLSANHYVDVIAMTYATLALDSAGNAAKI